MSEPTRYSLPMLPVFTESQTDGLYCLWHDVRPHLAKERRYRTALRGVLRIAKDPAVRQRVRKALDHG